MEMNTNHHRPEEVTMSEATYTIKQNSVTGCWNAYDDTAIVPTQILCVSTTTWRQAADTLAHQMKIGFVPERPVFIRERSIIDNLPLAKMP